MDRSRYFFSLQFDPAKALSSVELKAPVSDARPLDNIHQCRRLLAADHPDYLVDSRAAPVQSSVAVFEKERAKQRGSYLQQQRDRQRHLSNPLQEIAEHVKHGPLLLLRRWYEERQSVRVVTRHQRGVRGVAVGMLLAFDKHCNLVLRDVEETYTVLRTVERATARGTTRLCPKQERRHRKLKQVFIAGSSVVLISASATG